MEAGYSLDRFNAVVISALDVTSRVLSEVFFDPSLPPSSSVSFFLLHNNFNNIYLNNNIYLKNII